MRKLSCYLLCAMCLAGLFAGCSDPENDDDGWIYDFVNPSVCFFVSDAVGTDLLDPATDGSILGRTVAVIYDGKRYEVTEEADADVSRMTRATYVRPLALRLEKNDPLGNIKGWHLAFGDFSPTRDYRDQSFVLEWGDGTSTKVEFDLYTTWGWDKKLGRKAPTVHSPIRVDGVDRGEGYYDAWIIRIVR